MPEARGHICLSRMPNPKEPHDGVQEMARLALPLPGRLYEMLEKTAVEGEKEQSFPEYEDILAYLNKLYPEGDVSRSVDMGLHFGLYLEVLAAVAGSLGTAKPEAGSSFPSAKSNLILHSPVEGGITRLDGLVQDVAAELSADLITLDSQDIAELVGEYLGDGADASSFSLRSLGYDTYRSKSDGFELEEDEYDDVEGEEDAEDGQDDALPASPGRTSPASNGGKKGSSPFIIAGIQAMQDGDIFKALAGPGRGSSGRNAAMGAADFAGAPFGREASPETAARYNEMKLGAYLDALLDSTTTKRAGSQKDSPELNHSTNPDAEGQEHNPSQSTEPLVIGEVKREMVMGETERYRLTLDKSKSQEAQKPSSPRTIVLIKDYKELSVTRQGARVLDKFTELVHNRRKDGSQIMIIGTTSSAELVPEVSRSAIRSLQAENEDSFFRTIVVPIGSTSLRPSIEVQRSLSLDNLKAEAKSFLSTSASFDFVEAERKRNMDINLRHIRDMIERLVPTPKESLESEPTANRPKSNSSDPQETRRMFDRDGSPHLPLSFPGIDWNSRVLAFHEVHRIAQTAIGLHQAASDSPEMGRNIVVLAALLLRISDDVKFSWVAHERQKDREPKDTTTDASKAAPVKTPSDLKLEKIQKTANKHEKKLLMGVVNPTNIKTTFSDVHAAQETIDALKLMTSLSLLRPDAFSYGVLATDKIPGLLLYGPPGTGKTLLAKAVAKESGATVLEVSGSEVYDMYVGEGEKNVRAIFSLARKLSPCIVFIDEADAMFGSRSGSRHRTSHREVLNQFLKEWDGMNDLSVFIMVATNRPFDMDDAVLRRLPRRLLVDLPTQQDRQEILRIHLKGEQLDPAIKLDELAVQTPFYSGSDLKNLCVAAALNCVREENECAAAIRATYEADAEESNDASSESNANLTEVEQIESVVAEAAEAVEAAEANPTATTTTKPTTSQTSAPTNDFFNPATPSLALDQTTLSKDQQQRQQHHPSEQKPTTTTTTTNPNPDSAPEQRQPDRPPTPTPPPTATMDSLYPARRTLLPHHFEQAMQEISASISEDMATLSAIRKFDEQYGDKRGKRKKRSSWGFAVAEDVGPGEEAARVRQK